MRNLLEVVFEGVLKSSVIQLLMLLVNSSKCIINTQCSENIDLQFKDKLSEDALDKVLSFESDVSVLINLQNLTTENIELPKVLLRLVKYGEQYDIDFNFEVDTLDDANLKLLITSLHHDVNKIAIAHNVDRFYCGLEPASDESTRYFTNGNMGPL